MVTISTLSLYQWWQEYLCCAWFTHHIDALLSTHFMHLLVDSILWNFMKWNKNSLGAMIPNSSAHVELRAMGIPSTGPAPWTRKFWFPISNHLKMPFPFPYGRIHWSQFLVSCHILGRPSGFFPPLEWTRSASVVDRYAQGALQCSHWKWLSNL